MEDEDLMTEKKIVEAASELFYEKGYEETSIDDICNEVGVSHGLFYYYFKSKEEMIEEIAMKAADEMENELIQITEDSKKSADEKFIEFVNVAFQIKSKKEFLGAFLPIRDEPKIFYPLYTEMVEMMTPYLTKIVEQGIDEGIFETNYPEQTIKFWLYGRLFLIENSFSEDIFGDMMAGASIVERLLGTENDFLTSIYERYEGEIKKIIKESRER